MPMKIIHPYSETPYDILSVPDDPQLGRLPMDATHKAMRLRFPLLSKWWASHPTAQPKRNPTELAKALDQMGFPGRVLIDIFLCTTLDKAGDFEGLIKQQENLPLKLPAPVLSGWESDLEPCLVLPEQEITLEEVSISHQQNYDDPQIDLYDVRFDS
jgi:hypothetical protein